MMNTIRVLLVEDDKDTASLLQCSLGQNGFEVTTADSGDAALIALDQSNFDAMVCDMTLPDCTGFELMPIVREWHEIAAVALSDKASQKQIDQILAAGFDALLAKPADLDKLSALLRKLTRKPTHSRPLVQPTDVASEMTELTHVHH